MLILILILIQTSQAIGNADGDSLLLSLAATKSSAAMVDMLIDYGADVNAQSGYVSDIRPIAFLELILKINISQHEASMHCSHGCSEGWTGRYHSAATRQRSGHGRDE